MEVTERVTFSGDNIPRCPRCVGEIDAEAINASKDIAHCRACNEVWSLAEIMTLWEEHRAAIAKGRPGGAYERETAEGWVVGATTRKPGSAFVFLFPAAAFLAVIVWAGVPCFFTAIFGSMAIAFLIVGNMLLFGRVEVRRVRNGMEAFSGIGDLGWRRRFSAESVRTISVDKTTTRVNDRPTYQIVIHADRRIPVGHWLTSERKVWVAARLRERVFTGQA